jgi:xanthine dehydrogenase accessory factor
MDPTGLHSGDAAPTVGAANLAALRWLGEGRSVAAATLVEAVGSAPFDPGAVMLVDAAGNIEGSVTGGCVEGALFEECQQVLAGAPPRLVTYGISDDAAVGVGLMCGGTVRVFVQALDQHAGAALQSSIEAAAAGRPAALATVLDGPSAGARLAVVEGRQVGSLGGPERLDLSVVREAGGLLDQGASAIRRFAADGRQMGTDLRVFIQAFAEPARLVIFGAVDYAVAVARLAAHLGFRTTICDAREPFVRSERYAEVAEVVVDWPDRYLDAQELGPRDAVLVFSHDPKFDVPALSSAVSSGAGYIGALGSRRTHAQRIARLEEAGLTRADLDRISAPCGLDIGARTPYETAVSVLAEVVARRTGRDGRALSDGEGSIRGRATAEGEAA